ncbi:MAG TPA: CBS domain-containing protein [Thiobacillaceae bacterium]|nr:CBS domain-containing protein [Thiobacillaceae bacterium]HNU64370.1 CBS domain-containing protein [Thiobacillaceae bacterium]
MNRTYSVIPSAPMQKGTSFHKPRQALPERVSLDDPMASVMTDFKVVTAYTIFPLETIEAAREKMIHRGVRMLLVVDDMNHILGLITATDLTGEKPMQVVQTQGIRHSDVLVKDIMTPRERLEVLDIEDLQMACVGDVVATLKAHGRQHALVVERTLDQAQCLRGMFSVSQINRQLNTLLEVEGVASTFAELGAHLGS